MTSCKPISTGWLTCRFWSSFFTAPASAAKRSSTSSTDIRRFGFGLSDFSVMPTASSRTKSSLSTWRNLASELFVSPGWWWSFQVSGGAGGWKLDMLEDANRYSRIEGLKNGILRRLWDHLCISDWMAVVASCFQTKPHWNGGPLFWVAQSFFATYSKLSMRGSSLHTYEGSFLMSCNYIPVMLAKNHPNASAKKRRSRCSPFFYHVLAPNLDRILRRWKKTRNIWRKNSGFQWLTLLKEGKKVAAWRFLIINENLCKRLSHHPT